MGTAARAETATASGGWRSYTRSSSLKAASLFAPGPREQLAAPAVSPDGKSVAFIGGWMSDFGSTGGDAYVLRLDQPGAEPKT